MKPAADMTTGDLCAEVLNLNVRGTEEPWETNGWTVTVDGHVLARFDGDIAYASDVVLAARYRSLAPEAARRLQVADQELKDVRAALEIGPGEPIEGELVDAIEGLQAQAKRAAEVERELAKVRAERDALRCDMRRGQSS